MRIVPKRHVRIVPMKLKIKLPKVSSQTEIVSFDELDTSSIRVFPSYVQKVSLKTVKNNCYDDGVIGMSQRPVLLKNTDGGASATSDDMKQIPNKNKLHISSSSSSIGDHPRLDSIHAVSDIYMQSSVSHANNKRGAVRNLVSQQAKKQKIDSDQMMVQCLALLNMLINDKRGWGFRNPVDPVALNIPDYFSVISKPMDLGTIKSKLEKELYTNTEEFAADVRLMFNNAMLYNPPANYFHVVAKELKELFELRLKVLESKWSAERLRATQPLNSDERLSTTINMKQDTHRSSQASCPQISENVSTTSVPKQKRRKALVEISNKFSQPLLDQRDDEVTSCKPQKVTRSCHHSRSVETAHTQNSSGRNSLQKDFHEGIGYSSRQASVSISNKSKTSSACMNGSWESMNSLVSHHNSFSSDSERSSARANSNACHVGVRNLPPLVNETASRQMSKAEKAGIEAQIQAANTASRMKEEMKLKMQREQEREAARIALEKMERTVEIYENLDILEDLEMLAACSVQDNFLVHRLERQGLFMKHEYLEDEEELESCSSRAVEMEHCNIDLKVESKMQREREREAAQIALQKVERTVEFYESMEIMKDLQMLGVFSEQDNFRVHPLERLGLFMKDKYLEDEEELESCSHQVVEVEHCNIDLKVDNCSANLNLENNNNVDVEEGEIVE